MQDTVKFTINLDGNAYTGIAQLDKALGNFNVKASSTPKLLESINQAAFKINNIFHAAQSTIGSVVNTMRTFEAANMQQVEGESRLAQVMRNTMDATDGQIDAIKELVSVQQQLGVVGDEVQMAGLFIGDDAEGMPQNDIEKLRNLCEAREVLYVECDLLDVFNIKYIAIEKYDFAHTPGQNNQQFSTTAYSDDDFSLIVK